MGGRGQPMGSLVTLQHCYEGVGAQSKTLRNCSHLDEALFFSMKTISCFNIPKEDIDNVKTMVGGSITNRASATGSSPVVRTGQAPGVMQVKEEMSSALQTKRGGTHPPSSSRPLTPEIILSERAGPSISVTQNVRCESLFCFNFLSISFIFWFCYM